MLGALHRGILKDKEWLDMFSNVSQSLGLPTDIIRKLKLPVDNQLGRLDTVLHQCYRS